MTSAEQSGACASPAHGAAPRQELPRLLAGVQRGGAVDLAAHISIHGELAPPPHRHGRSGAGALIDEVQRAGLVGRGGGAFPTARKMRVVAGARGRAIVVVNALEGEPASQKDRVLAQSAPHLVLEGAVVAARAVGAREVVVCLSDGAPQSARSLSHAHGQCERLHQQWPEINLFTAPGGYVAGQESALVNCLNGGPPKPMFLTRMLGERGVQGRPTLVLNVETLAHLALIARHGAAWYRGIGTPDEPGSTLVTLSGPVARPGVYEIENGSSLRSLVAAAGGITEPVRAGLLGGYAGAWVPGARLGGLVLSRDGLEPHGAMLGPGVIALLPAAVCAVAQTASLAHWMAAESAGQCGPCINGLDAIAGLLQRIARGTQAGQGEQSLSRLSALVRRRGACAHPDGVARMLDSAVEVFAQELSEHSRHGPCEACDSPGTLPLPGHGAARELALA